MYLKTKGIITGALLFVVQTAWAGGYQLNEYSVTGLGRAFAGAGVVGDDYSALAFNPAGMSLKKSGMQGGLTLIQLKSDVTNLDSSLHGKTPGTIRLYSPVPHAFGQYKVTDRLDVGLGVYMPFGLSTKYSWNWFGSDQAVQSLLEVIDIAPAVSYKLTDQWTIGGTFIARYIHGKMTNTISKMNAENEFDLDGWTKTGILGVMYEPVKNTRFGLSYKFRSKQTVKGDHTVEMPFGRLVNNGSASPDLPDSVLFSAYHKLNPKIGLSGSIRWTHWSVFKDFVMESDSPVLASLNGEYHSEYRWKNAWTTTVGLDYYYNQNWTFRIGTGYDESPSHSTVTRTARIPDNDRIWATCGFSYMYQNFTVDVGYAHMFMRTTEVDHTDVSGNKVHAKYDSQSNMLGMQL